MTPRILEPGFLHWLSTMAAWFALTSLVNANPDSSGEGESLPAPPKLRRTPLPLEPVYRLKPADGKLPFATRSQVEAEKLSSRLDGLAFFGVVTNGWPAGLVPVFAVENANRFELRRRPALGQENSSEPLFFALPPEDEPHSAKITGHWECNAIRGGSKVFLSWELAVEGEKISGRFDQNTDYRFGNIVGGTFSSNRLELRVEYVMDAYGVTGDWRDGRLQGEWRHTEDAERGTWEATRQEIQIPPSSDAVALHEWRRASDNACQYLLDGTTLEGGWQRSARPLCRVWRPPAKDED